MFVFMGSWAKFTQEIWYVWPVVWFLKHPAGQNVSINSIYMKSWNSGLFQFSSVTQSCPTLCNPMNRSMPGLPVHHQLPEFTQTHAHRVSDAIQPSRPLSSTSPPAPNPSQHHGLFQWFNSSHEVAKVLELWNIAHPVKRIHLNQF